MTKELTIELLNKLDIRFYDTVEEWKKDFATFRSFASYVEFEGTEITAENIESQFRKFQEFGVRNYAQIYHGDGFSLVLSYATYELAVMHGLPKSIK